MKALILALLLACGCASPIAQTGDILEVSVAESLICEVLSLDRSLIISSDLKYSTCEENWVKTKFAPGFNRFKFNLKVTEYKADSNDCDNQARGSTFYAQALYSQNHINSTLLFGEFFYEPDSGGRHVVNFFLTKDKQILFFCPQYSKIEKLTEKEIQSCYRIIF